MFIGTEQSKYIVHFQSYDVTTFRIGSYPRDFELVGDTGICKVKCHPRTCHEVPNWEHTYSCTSSLISALDVVGGQRHSSAALPPGNIVCAHSVVGSLGTRARLDGCEKPRSPSGFDHRTVKSVASSYTHWAIPAHGGYWKPFNCPSFN